MMDFYIFHKMQQKLLSSWIHVGPPQGATAPILRTTAEPDQSVQDYLERCVGVGLEQNYVRHQTSRT